MSRQNRCAPVAVIVDDCPETRQTAASAAHACGWEAELFASPEELFLLAFPPEFVSDLCVPRADAFLVSLDFPSLEGRRLVNWLAASERWGGVPLAGVTARGERALHPLVDSAVPVLGRPLTESELTAFFEAAAAVEPGFPLLARDAAAKVSGLLSREISRARRGGYPFSLLLLRPTVAFGEGDGPVIGAALLGDWNRLALRRACRSVRETDVLLDLGADGLLAALPFAGCDALQRLDTRLHDALRPVLRELGSGCRGRISLATAGASFPEEAPDWRSLLNLALDRMSAAVEGRSIRLQSRAA